MFSKPMTSSTAALIGGAVAILAASAIGAPAQAQPLALRYSHEPIKRTERVYVGDLDLRVTPELATASARVEGAIGRVCANPNGPGPAMRAETRNCERQTRARAKRNLQRIVKLSFERAYARAD